MKRLAALAALALLTACLLVDDFGHSWEEATPDTCLDKIAESLYYNEFQRNPEGKDMGQIARGLKRTNGMTYLLVKKDEHDRGGRMYRFQVVNGIFQRLRIVPTQRATFEQNYPNAPVKLDHDMIRFTQLGADEWDLIDNIATQPEYWEIEDQTLYNPMKDPACKFEDRDLSKLEN